MPYLLRLCKPSINNNNIIILINREKSKNEVKKLKSLIDSKLTERRSMCPHEKIPDLTLIVDR